MEETTQSRIRNTTEAMRDPAEALLALAVSTGPGGPGQFIEEQERAGQSQFVNSDRLPKAREGDEPYLALGFTFGPYDEGDPLFRPATLPEGWKREASDHNMWSYIVDQYGRRRVAVFYKAAFYDRRANMHLESPSSYLRSRLYDGTGPVLDDEWLTPAVVRETLEAIASAEDNEAVAAEGFAAKSPDDTYWPDRAEKHRAEAAKARRLAESLGGAA